MSAIVTVFRIYAINILVLTTFAALFSDVYHFSRGNVGLAYIGPGVGYVIAAIVGAQMSNKIYSTVSTAIYK